MQSHDPSFDSLHEGMQVRNEDGDLGEQDLSPPKVKTIHRDGQGQVTGIDVAKGSVFRETVQIPASRIEAVEPGSLEKGDGSGAAIVRVPEEELEHLPTGTASITEHPSQGLLDQVEQQIPTERGMRELERKPSHAPSQRSFWQILGPGLLSGTSGNDPSAVTTYAIDGATVGYGHLWLLLISTPLYLAVQFACARIGRVSKKGLSELLSAQYGRPVSLGVSLLLVLTNVSLIAADLAAVALGLELATGGLIGWYWFVVPVAVGLWYLTVFGNFESFKKIFLTMSFVFIAYVLAAFFTRPNWPTVLLHTFVPSLSWNFASISSAIALLGATISPYSMFWQAEGETEQLRSGPLNRQLREVKVDVASGAISGQLVAYFIIITTASTLFVHHSSITTAADAARSLEPLAGPLARYLFAIGLIGAGLVAIPVLMASTSYAVAGSLGWPGGLAKRPWQNEGFYLILTGALLVGLGMTLLGINPIHLIFWANVGAGVVAPLLVIAVLLVGNHPKVMREERLSWLNSAGLVLTILILLVAVVLLFVGLLTGQQGS